jgi:hypothetical protein
MHLCVSVGARCRLQLLHHMVTMDPTARRVYDSGELVNFLAIDAARTGDGLVPNLHWRTWFVPVYSAVCCITCTAGASAADPAWPAVYCAGRWP